MVTVTLPQITDILAIFLPAAVTGHAQQKATTIKMIIIQVEGGLGNQMFQCALALSFINKGITAKLDIAPFKTQRTHNGYELDKVFSADLLYCSALEKTMVKTYSKLRHKLFGTPYKEKEALQWQYDAAVNTLQNGYLKGYWQCEKYFADAAELVKQTFSFAPLQEEKNIALLEQIQQCNAVSLHIRRGDYLSAGINASLGIDYYTAAIQYINRTVDNPVYFVFSDDMEWARQNTASVNAVYTGWNKGTRSYMDMQLMSHCKHNIIANSSFSWWGAWLNDNKEKTVIAPTPWMPSHKSAKEVIPAKWIELPAGFVNTNDHEQTI